MTKQNIPINQIRKDGGTQSRAAIDDAVVNDYAETIKDGQKLPPIKLFYDGDNYWLADGFHRLAAHEAAGKRVIAADVRQGTQREAVLYSVGANSTHGLRRTNADKRRAVETLLADEEWRQWSDREIARRCGVHHTTVANIRSDMVSSGEISQIENRQVQRGDTVYEQKTTKIGSNPETLYSHEPTDDVAVEHARQVALLAIGSSMVEAEDKMRGSQYTGNSNYSVRFGGGNIWLDLKTPQQRAEKCAREQIAIVIHSPDRLFRFNIKKLMEWKLARRDEQITRIDAPFNEGDKVKALPGKFIIFRLDWDGTYKQTSDLSFERIVGDRLIFGYAFRTDGMELAEVYKYQGGRPFVVNLACLRADTSESKSAIQAGDTVQAKSGQIGTVKDASGRYVKVETSNGEHTYSRDNLSVVQPPQSDDESKSDKLLILTPEGLMSLNLPPEATWIERYRKVQERFIKHRLVFASLKEGMLFLEESAHTVFNLLNEHRDSPDLEWGRNTASGVGFWVLLKSKFPSGCPLATPLWDTGVKGVSYREIAFNRDDLRPLSAINDVQDGYAEKREFETMLAEVNLNMNSALSAIKEFKKVYPGSDNNEICNELFLSVLAVRDGLVQLLGVQV